ncbi:MAG: KpsF/GutQ family sugar-phosphate isomerase [Bdellovibrionaceae bacterium]|nr:KpsF/GutQ family sugar-phosphate isomerase [Pseudobdellovibrionaceae bacterium]
MHKEMQKDIQEAVRVFEIEARAIEKLKSRLDERFVKALDLLHRCEGKIIVSGMGKSGQIGRKISSTLSSTGSPSVFLHPAESSHGDLGVVAKGDVILAISYGGEVMELRDLLQYAARKSIPIVALCGKSSSTLAKASEVCLDISVDEEACPMGLAPTASSTATLALGDALAVALLKRRGFKEQDFAEYHPGGALGRRLLTRVEDVMHLGDALPVVRSTTPMREVIAQMTQKEVRGVAGVVDEQDNLIGIVTDGDIRRRLEKSGDPLAEKAGDIMSMNPKTIDAQELAEKALFVMEQFRIQTLFVVNRASPQPQKPVGLLHLQDLIKAKIR